jgi:hypothetical protein
LLQGCSFAFDKDATPRLQMLLIIFGIVLSSLGLLVCCFGEIVRRAISSDIKKLNGLLENPLDRTIELPHIKYTVITSALFSIAVLMCWLYLLVTTNI